MVENYDELMMAFVDQVLGPDAHNALGIGYLTIDAEIATLNSITEKMNELSK